MSSTHLLAGFESQIDARGCAAALTDAARAHGVTIDGAALARCDTVSAIRVDPIDGFPMPAHVLGVLDSMTGDDVENPAIPPGETILVMRLPDAAEISATDLADAAGVHRRGALWVKSA